MLTLPKRGEKFRDERGRFRRKTRDDMGQFELIMHDFLCVSVKRMADDLIRGNVLLNALTEKRIGTTIRIRRPADYQVLDTIPLVAE